MAEDPPKPARVRMRRAALARWEDEGGAGPHGPPVIASDDQAPAPPVPPLSDAELIQLRIRVIALENAVIGLLASGTEAQREAVSQMADYISPRAGETHHPLTLKAADQMRRLVDRAKPFEP